MSAGIAEQAAMSQSQVVGLNDMPPEIVLQIFYQLLYVINNGKGHRWLTEDFERITSMAELNRIATVSKHVYRCFKDSEFAIFRRLVHWTLVDHSDIPGFADLVIKIGSLKFMKDRPTDPDEIERILKGVQRDEWRRRSRRHFTPEVSVKLEPKHYDGVLDWLASYFRAGTILNNYYRRLNKTESRGIGVPPQTFVIHPFDVLYPQSVYDVPMLPKSERVEFYISQLLEEVEKWRKHVKTPWTKEETEYLDSAKEEDTPLAEPCCLAIDCPRRPHNGAEQPFALQWLNGWRG